jgi:hypothetical protein
MRENFAQKQALSDRQKETRKACTAAGISEPQAKK